MSGLLHPQVLKACLLQNASLTVMTEGSIWSMTSTDSLWGDDEDLPHDESPAAEGKPSLETWLLLEFCDRGSLLVGTPCLLVCMQCMSAVTHHALGFCGNNPFLHLRIRTVPQYCVLDMHLHSLWETEESLCNVSCLCCVDSMHVILLLCRPLLRCSFVQHSVR